MRAENLVFKLIEDLFEIFIKNTLKMAAKMMYIVTSMYNILTVCKIYGIQKALTRMTMRS